MDTRDAFCIVFLIMIAGATATPIQTKELTQTIEETRGNEDVPEQTILSIVNQCVLDDGSPGENAIVSLEMTKEQRKDASVYLRNTFSCGGLQQLRSFGGPPSCDHQF